MKMSGSMASSMATSSLALVAMRERGGGELGNRRKPRRLQKAFRLLLQIGEGGGVAEDRRPLPRFCLDGEADVSSTLRPGNRFVQLKGPPDACLGACRGRQPRNVRLTLEDAPLGGHSIARDEVEPARLAGAVGPTMTASSPGTKARDTLSTAACPPKRMVRFSVRMEGDGNFLSLLLGAPPPAFGGPPPP